MPTSVIDLLAGLSVAEAVFLALMLFGSAACVWLLLVDVRVAPDSPVGRAVASVRQTAVHAGHDLSRWAATAWLYAAKAVLLARVVLSALLLVVAAHLTPAASNSKGNAR